MTLVAAVLGVTALVAAALGPMAPAVVASPAPVQASGANAAKVAVGKLAANGSYPYTQLVVSVPKLSGAKVTAQDAALATGLRFVVASEKSHRGAAGLTVYYKSAELGQLRTLGGNVYVLADVAKWQALPMRWGAAAKKELSAIDVVAGERWFELTGATLEQLGGKGATSSIGPLSTALRTWASKLVGSLGFTEIHTAGGNLAFSAQGTFMSLRPELVGLAALIGKAMHTAGPYTSTDPKGTYSLRMSTAAAGRYISDMRIALRAADKNSVTLSVTFAHAREPVTAPQGAKVVTPSALSGMMSGMGL